MNLYGDISIIFLLKRSVYDPLRNFNEGDSLDITIGQIIQNN